MKIARNHGCLGGVENEKAFLFRVARNTALDHSRRSATRTRHYRALAGACADLFAREADPDTVGFQRALARALGDLPEKQRSVVYLKLWEDETFGQIGEICGVSSNTAASRFRYGIEKLRAHLRPIYNEITE